MSSALDEGKSILKQVFTLKNILIGLGTFIVLAIIADMAGLTNWLLFPVSTAKAKWGNKTSNS